MKKRVIVNYSSTFGLPGVSPDAGMALIHLLCSDRIQLEAIVIAGSSENLCRITSSLNWLLKFSGRPDVRVFGGCADSDEKSVDRAVTDAAEFLVAYLRESAASGKEQAVLLDIGESAAIRLAADKVTSLSEFFSEIVFWNPRPIPPQRLGVEYPEGSLADKALAEVFRDSGCKLTMLGDDIAFQTPLDVDELVGIRGASKPLYYLLRDYLLRRAHCEKSFSRDYLYRLPSAVYLTHPELFPVEKKMVKGLLLNNCSHINDIKAYGSILLESWGSWHKAAIE